MQASNANSFPFSSGADLASQNALMQGLGMNPQGLSAANQGALSGFMQNQQPIGYPMFDQGMQNNYQSPQGALGMNQFNPMLMQQNMGHQMQGYGLPQNAMGFQMQQQMMNSGSGAMMGGLGDPGQLGQMNPYGGMNPQALLAQTLQGAQLQNAYGSADAMSMIQGMMGSNSRGHNNQGDNYNMHGGGNNQRFNSNNQNNDGALRLNTVYISDLPQNVDHDMIKDNFSKVGSIKLNSKSGMPMIWIFKDRGVPKGDALVTYDSNSSASNAINYFKENDFNGKTIDVRIATNAERPILAPPGSNQNDNMNNNNGGGGGNRNRIESVYRHNEGDGYNSWSRNEGGGGGGRQRGGSDFRGNNNNNRGDNKNRGPDWMCVKCNNNNFSWRESCNRCQEPKTDDAVEIQKQDRGARGFSGPRSSNNRMVHKNTTSRSQDGGPMRGPKKAPSSRPGPY